MTREEMIAYIVDYIQTDVGLVKLMRFVVTNNINNSTQDSMPDARLAMLIAYLQQ